MNKGEIYKVELPPPPGGEGHEQTGFRPVIVISCSHPSMVTVVPITSQSKAQRYPFVFEIQPTHNNGLNTLSYALVFQITTFDKTRFKNRLGRLEGNYLEILNTQLIKYLELP